MSSMLESNLFHNVAETLSRKGEDCEMIAAELARALKYQIVNGASLRTNEQLSAEFIRLLDVYEG